MGLNPQAMAINHVTHKLYVADLGDSKVWIIDASNNAVLTSVTVGAQPRSIAVNEVTNKIYVPGFASNDLTVIDGAADTTQTVTGFGTGPGAVAVNPLTNQIFVANITSGTVSVVNGVDNTFSSPSVTVGDNTSQAAIVVDPQTNVAYVSIKGRKSDRRRWNLTGDHQYSDRRGRPLCPGAESRDPQGVRRGHESIDGHK